ncbi:MAG: BON domain-containing protein [candidate division Zixibacteria bacterium]|nr:BON domain-containing protein [candidate division Zixibacteria bacterium]
MSKRKYINQTFYLMLIICLTAFSLNGISIQAEELDDTDISTAIKEALLFDHGVSGFKVDVTTNNGIVTLTGEVINILAKERAATIAETVKGVRSVINNIEVVTKGLSDNDVLNNVEAALILDPATESFEVTADVDNRIVTLTGNVDSWQERWLAARVAKGVKGVKGIINNINVDVETTRTDREIEQEVEQVLRWNVLIDHALIDVDVNNRKVTLSGTVGSAAEKSRAEMSAWVAGVIAVDSDQLEVQAWARDERFRQTKYENLTDLAIKQAVKDALFYDSRVKSYNISVDVENGTAKLLGIVDNLKAKRAAAKTASNTVGVWRVKNNISVRPEKIPSDSGIENNVELALMRDPYVEKYEIEVSVDNGEVTLSGEVDSYFEKAQADDAASKVNGVVSVNNNIVVEDEYDAVVYDPYVYDDWYLYDFDWYTYPDEYATTLTDWEIKEEIQEEFWWSPFIDSGDITIIVEDGVATLKGNVDTWLERSTATQNAFEAGAIAVDNDLKVEKGPDYYNR